MSDFVNTIDLLGDSETLKRIVEGTITEFKDNVIEEIDDYAFNSRKELVNVDLPNVTGSTGLYTFEVCSKLKTVNMPNITVIGGYAFCDCTSLTSVSFPLATQMSNYAFQNCTSLTDINFPQLKNTSTSAFDGCTSLTSVSLPLLEKVGSSCFRNCTSLESVSLPSVTGSLGGSPFNGCTALKDVYVPNATQSGSYAFQNCTSLEYLDLPKFQLISNNNFKGCSSLKTLILRLETGCTLPVTDAFAGTPFASGGTGGKCLVPRALIETFYQTGTNWSAMYAEGTCTFLALEDYTVDGTITGAIDWDKLNGGTT